MTVAVTISEICDVNPSLRTAIDRDELVGFVGMASLDAQTAIASDDDQRPYAEVAKAYTPFEDGDVLVAKITPCFENGKIAQARTTTPIAFGSTEFHVLRPHEGVVDHRYLLHFLRCDSVLKLGEMRMTGAGGQRRVPARLFDELQIPLPSMQEQRRIASVLDAADALRAKRRRFLDKLDSLTQSIFVDIFAKSGWNSWGLVSIADLAADEKGSVRTGPFGSQLLHEEFTDHGIAVLGIDNAVQNRFEWAERRYISEEKYADLRRYTVRPGDVLVTIMGTCGRVAVVPEDIPTAINTKHLCCITLDHERCLPDFLWASLRFHPGVLHQLGATRGAVMPGLNMGLIKQAEVPLPPINEQVRFVERKAAVERQLDAAHTDAGGWDELFHSLQQRAFRGEL